MVVGLRQKKFLLIPANLLTIVMLLAQTIVVLTTHQKHPILKSRGINDCY
jgi:hypothetical protein